MEFNIKLSVTFCMNDVVLFTNISLGESYFGSGWIFCDPAVCIPLNSS